MLWYYKAWHSNVVTLDVSVSNCPISQCLDYLTILPSWCWRPGHLVFYYYLHCCLVPPKWLHIQQRMICNKVTKDHSFSIPPHQPLCLYLCIFHCHCQVWERVLTIRPTRSVVKDNLSPLISHKGDHRYHYYVQCPQWPYYNVHSGEKATSAQPNHRSSLTTSKCSQWRPCRSSMHTNIT